MAEDNSPTTNPTAHSPETWESHRETIRHLYLDCKSSLQDLCRVMRDEYGFIARPRQYKTKLRIWNFQRNLPAKVKRFIILKRDERTSNGKQTAFEFNGRPVQDHELKRRRDRLQTQNLRNLQTDSTPPGLHYYTPPLGSPILDAVNPSLSTGPGLFTNLGLAAVMDTNHTVEDDQAKFDVAGLDLISVPTSFASPLGLGNVDLSDEIWAIRASTGPTVPVNTTTSASMVEMSSTYHSEETWSRFGVFGDESLWFLENFVAPIEEGFEFDVVAEMTLEGDQES